MASSACNRICALGIAAVVLAGCATGPKPEKPAGETAGTEQGEAGKPELTEPQKAEFEHGAKALEAGNADAAVAAFKKLVEARPDLAAAHANLGTAYMMRGDDALAISSFQRAIALNPDLVKAQVRLGVLHRRAGDFDKAEAAYRAALKHDPESRYAHLNLGILYDVYLQKPQQALTHYQRFQELSDKPDEEVAKWIADLKQRL